MSSTYQNPINPETKNVDLPANTLWALMVAIHKITPELAQYHVAKMTHFEIAEQLRFYRRSVVAVRFLTRIRRENPELWAKIRQWAEREAGNGD